MSEMIKNENLPNDLQSENAYLSIRGYVIDAQRQVYSAVAVKRFFGLFAVSLRELSDVA